jgi:hypothetical protein
VIKLYANRNKCDNRMRSVSGPKLSFPAIAAHHLRIEIEYKYFMRSIKRANAKGIYAYRDNAT